MTRASLGGIAPEVITVATTLLLSWNPFRKPKIAASPSRTNRDMDIETRLCGADT